MSFTFTDRNAKTVLHSWGRFRGAVEEAVVVGDLLAIKVDADSGFQLANVTNTQTAVAVACQDGEADQTIWMAMIAELKAPTTIATGGVATQTYFAASGDTMGSAVYLSTTDGKLSSSQGAVVQLCGYILARDRVLVVPTTYLSATSLAISGALTVGTTLGVTGATTLGNTLAVTGVATFTTNLVPATTDEASLGTNLLNFSDLFLDSGAVINFNSGDVTITHSNNKLTVAGGRFDYAGGDITGNMLFGTSGSGVDLHCWGDSASHYMTWDSSADALVFAGGAHLTLPKMGSGRTVDGDIWLDTTAASHVLHYYSGSTGGEKVVFDTGGGDITGNVLLGTSGAGVDLHCWGATGGKYMTWDASADALILAGGAGFTISGGGATALTGTLTVTGAILPTVSNTPALGSTSYYWADLFLGNGAVINFNADVTITHSANKLTVAGGRFDYAGGDITGNVLLGTSGAGVDLHCWGATGGKYMTWDASADLFILLPPPTSDPGVTGALWSSSGTAKFSGY